MPWALPLFALVAAGAFLGQKPALPVGVPALGFVLLAGLALVLPSQRGRALLVAGAAVLAGALSAAHARGLHERAIASLPVGERVVVEGIARDVAPTRRGGQRVELDVTGLLEGTPGETRARAVRATVELRLVRSAAAVAVAPGDRLRVRAKVLRLEEKKSPGSFDAALFGLARGLSARLVASQRSQVALVERGARAAPFGALRAHLRARLLELVTPKEAGILLALLIGDTAFFDEEDLAVYRRVGAGHLLAVSGLQVTLLSVIGFRLALFLCLLVGPLRRRALARPLATLVALVGVWLFVGLCGAPPSAVRAAGMATALLGALSLGRRVRGGEAVGLAGLVTVLLSPTSVVDPSFLLSYGAVVGLLVAVPKGRPQAARADSFWAQQRQGLSRSLYAFRALCTAALSAGLCTLPISAHLFGEVAPAALLTNIVLVPAASLLQVPAIGLGLFGALVGSPLLASLGAAAGGLLEALCAGFDAMLGAVWTLTAPGPLESALLFFAAALVGLFLARPKQVWALALSAGLVAAAHLPMALEPRGVRITALPVGQGDGLVVELPGGEVFLVDGGGVWDERYDPGASVVLPYLRRRGIREIDVMVLSHPHPDHLLGLLPVLEAVPVREVWQSGYGREHPLMRRLLAAAGRAGAKVRDPRELVGAHAFGPVRVEVLAPFPEDGDALYEELDENDNSLVLRVVYGEDAALLTGDLERWGERYLLAHGVDLRARVVKAPHHGSRTSSTPAFVRATKAEHVLFTTGEDNPFGFPHAEVVKRWREAGARLWDTAVHGEITFVLTGAGVQVTTTRDGRVSQ